MQTASNANDSAENTRKRKWGGEEAKQDRKLQEYLSVLQRPSKSKTWGNDEEMLKPVEDKSPAGDEDAEAGDATDDSRTQKKVKVDGPGETSRPEPEPILVDHSGPGDGLEDPTARDPSAATQMQDEQVSDSDWLRSKTSRLLGLLDEEEQAELDAGSQQKAASKEVEADRNHDTRDAEGIPAQPKDADEVDKALEADKNVELIRISSRLFVRNLPYDAKESDLGTLFVPFGKIEEVSAVLQLTRAACFP